MRKKKRDYGEYVDDETGSVCIVQTTKQVKRAHQKSGKWYKEPTAAELRIWDREEKQQAAAQRVARREENKKLNAAKRFEKEAKEHELKRQQFEAGKITFTQTLAKKDEDQPNLHSWFGGRPKQGKSRQHTEKKNATIEVANKDAETENDKENVRSQRSQDEVACKQRHFKHERVLSQQNTDAERGSKSIRKAKVDSIADSKTSATVDLEMDTMQADLLEGIDLEEFNQDFDIAEDSDSDIRMMADDFQDTTNTFKVPSLPTHAQRLPLSPMSDSDVNIRASQSMQVSSFKEKLENASVTTAIPPSTQVVRDLLAGICTQDLVDDLDDADLINENKENEEPATRNCSTFFDSPIKCMKSSSLKETSSKINLSNTSFASAADSCDYDDIFANLEVPGEDAETEIEDFGDAFDDYGIDDSDLLSLPATQLTRVSKNFNLAKPAPASLKVDIKLDAYISKTDPPPKPQKKPLKKFDSFAVEGLSDDDLDQALAEFERSQKKLAKISSTSSNSALSDTLSRRKRTLPWDKAGWIGSKKTHLSSPDECATPGEAWDLEDLDEEEEEREGWLALAGPRQACKKSDEVKQ